MSLNTVKTECIQNLIDDNSELILALINQGMGGGYPCFFSSVVCIGIMTALINDVASHLGCTVGLKDSVTALAFVSLGTSLPGTIWIIFQYYWQFLTFCVLNS
jgi:hypothetical protein